MGILIAIDGLDGSGKKTQCELLEKNLKNLGYKTKLLSFPEYESDSSALVKMYLDGKISENADDINSYAASSFFAADRYISYMNGWKKDYDDDTVIIANRYTSANAIHQLTKLDKNKWDSFLSWLFEYEFSLLGIPAPDSVILLRVDVETSLKLIDKRGEKKDIHENETHLKKAYDAATYVAEKYNWDVINCEKDGSLMTVGEIGENVLKCVLDKTLKK